MTQATSRVRVKNDTVGEQGMKTLFTEYQRLNFTEFQNHCKMVIEQSSGKRETKDRFIREIDRATSKDTMLTKVTNYLLAGQGLGV